MEYYHCLITHSDGYFAKQTNCMKHNKLHIWVFTTFVRVRSRRGRDRMVVEITTTYTTSA
jgi:hypothetical protein